MSLNQKGISPIFLVILVVILLIIVVVFAKSKKINNSNIQNTQVSPLEASKGIKIEKIKTSGGMVDWSPSGNNLIAYDKPGTAGFYDIYTINPDGGDEICVTCNLSRKKQHGSPAWHPSGNWIAFLNEKQNHPGSSYNSLPGFGEFDDIWVISSDGKKSYPLVTSEDGENHGVLMPHFSPDGKKISWSKMYRKGNILTGDFGSWKLEVADFVIDAKGVPSVENIREYQPNDEVLYENHGFSLDGTQILFSSNFDSNLKQLQHNNIYSLNLADRKITQLTTDGYNEHSSYSPDGNQIIWMSNTGNPQTGGLFNKGTDWWIMDADGSNKKRLTFFNDPHSPDYQGANVWATRISWDPKGGRFVGYIQTDLLKQIGYLVMVTLEP